MRFDDLIKQPKKPRPLSYTESLEAKFKEALGEKPAPKFTAVEWAIMEGGGSLPEPIKELFDPKKASPIEWQPGLGVTYARSSVNLGGRKIPLDVTFAEEDDGLMVIEFMVGGEFGLTKQGGADVIFSTVIEAVKQFSENHPKVNAVAFTAHEQSRARMYDTLTKRVAKQIGWHVVPYEEMSADPKYKRVMSNDSFTFAIERGAAPASRQAAQQPQHGGFMPVFYVWSYETPELPAIKIKADKGWRAEEWVSKNVPEFKNEDPHALFAHRAPPPDKSKKIIDMGEVPPPKPKPPERVLSPLEKALQAKIGA